MSHARFLRPPPPTRWPWLLGLQIPLRLCQPVHFEHLCSRTIRGFGVPPSSLLAVTSAPPSHTASHPQSLRLPRRNPSTLRLPCLSPLPANFLTNPQSLHASRTPTLLQGAPRPLFLFLSQEPLRRGPLELTYPHLPIPSAPPHPFSWRTPPISRARPWMPNSPLPPHWLAGHPQIAPSWLPNGGPRPVSFLQGPPCTPFSAPGPPQFPLHHASTSPPGLLAPRPCRGPPNPASPGGALGGPPPAKHPDCTPNPAPLTQRLPRWWGTGPRRWRG